jgi:hypothetical protein
MVITLNVYFIERNLKFVVTAFHILLKVVAGRGSLTLMTAVTHTETIAHFTININARQFWAAL